VVQPPASPLWSGLDHTRHGPPRPGSQHLGAASGGPGRRLLSSPRTLRTQTAPSTRAALPGLDQQAASGGKNSLNFHAGCLILVDTHRRLIVLMFNQTTIIVAGNSKPLKSAKEFLLCRCRVPRGRLITGTGVVQMFPDR